MSQAKTIQHPGGWQNYRGTFFGRLYEACLILCGSHSLHRAWQRGYDQHIMDESARRARTVDYEGWCVANSPKRGNALLAARAALIKIRSCSIAGCEQGYGQPEKWADALFASHADVAAALKTIDEALAVPRPQSNTPEK